MAIKTSKDLFYGEIGYCKECKRYFYGKKIRDEEHCEHELEIVVTTKENENNDYTLLQFLLNGNNCAIFYNSAHLTKIINNPASILCSYNTELSKSLTQEKQQRVSVYDFIVPDTEIDDENGKERKIFYVIGKIELY